MYIANAASTLQMDPSVEFGRVNLNRLDLNLLVALDALLDEQSITKAASRLHLSTSAASGALSRLREFFSDELLTQIGRRMVPTPLGASLKAQVRDCLLHIHATVERRLSFDPATERRNFVLMMSDYVATIVMPAAAARLEREAPGVTFELLANTDTPWETLDRGDVDFLILPKKFSHPEHPAEVLFEDSFVCVVSTGNKLVGKHISMDQLLSLGHVVTRVGRHRPPTVDAWFFETFGHLRRTEIVAMSFNAVPHLVAGTNRVAMMHRRLAEVYCRTLPLRIIAPPVEMPPLIEVIQWHRYRESDPARIWLHEVLKAALPRATS